MRLILLALILLGCLLSIGTVLHLMWSEFVRNVLGGER